MGWRDLAHVPIYPPIIALAAALPEQIASLAECPCVSLQRPL
jgi:hypothetical protein